MDTFAQQERLDNALISLCETKNTTGQDLYYSVEKPTRPSADL